MKDILSQFFDVTQTDIALQTQVHMDGSYVKYFICPLISEKMVEKSNMVTFAERSEFNLDLLKY